MVLKDDARNLSRDGRIDLAVVALRQALAGFASRPEFAPPPQSAIQRVRLALDFLSPRNDSDGGMKESAHDVR